MTSAPTISVVIPFYNTEKYLGEAIDSVLAQSNPASEIILVNDGSTDDSLTVARSYGDKVRLIERENGGIAAARNTGAKATKCDLLTFLDADDLWTENSLDLRVKVMENEPTANVVFGALEQFLCTRAELTDGQNIQFIEGVNAARFAGTMMIQRKIFNALNGFDEDLFPGEIVDLCSRLDDAGYHQIQIPDMLMRRRIHGNNTMASMPDVKQVYLRALRAKLRRAKQGS